MYPRTDKKYGPRTKVPVLFEVDLENSDANSVTLTLTEDYQYPNVTISCGVYLDSPESGTMESRYKDYLRTSNAGPKVIDQ